MASAPQPWPPSRPNPPNPRPPGPEARICASLRRANDIPGRIMGLFAAIISYSTNQAPDLSGDAGMRARLLATLVKVAVASLIVGTILQHFGITADQVLTDFGITPERLIELLRRGFACALPNVLLGSLIIVPVWLVLFLFRPPGTRSE